MASIWRIFGSGPSSPPTISEFLQLSSTNIQRIDSLTSHEFHTEEPLNAYQCRSMSSKLVRTQENITGLLCFWDGDGSSDTVTPNTSTLSIVAFENFYLICERAKELVEHCCSVDWCQASTFQIQNEEAFKEILLETSLCYNTIYELVKEKDRYEDLRQTSIFEPPTPAEVMHDRMVLLQRYQNFLHNSQSSDTLIQNRNLAQHLLRRLSCITSQSSIGDFDFNDVSSWPDGKSPGDEWGKNSEFLGGNVCKTTWLDVPCAKKMFEHGVQEEEILAEARILARLNHPNIVKFICCGHDAENTWCHFIAMEQMERGLHSVIKKQAQLRKGPPFPLLSAVDIMLQIAFGTCYLHDNGVAHRDLKTCNVVVRQITTPHLQDYFQVKLVDFGLSKMKLSASRSNTISRPKTGTTVYMAPEVFQPGRANWFKADVYSFGIMCSVILSGKEPFQDVQRSKVYQAICNGERPMLPQEIPAELAWLIKKCWDTDRNVRPDFIDICTKLAKLRHNLLRRDLIVNGFKDERDDFASSYIEEVIKRQSDARYQDSKELLENVIEEDECCFPDEEFDMQKQNEDQSKMVADHTSNSSSYFEIPKLRNSTSNTDVDKGRSSISSLKRPHEHASTIPYPIHSEMQAKPNREGGTTLPQRVTSSSNELAPYSRSLTSPSMYCDVEGFSPQYTQSLTPSRQVPHMDGATIARAQRLHRENMRTSGGYYSKLSNPRNRNFNALHSVDDHNQGWVPSNMYEDRMSVRLFQDAYPDYNMPWTADQEADPHNNEDEYREMFLPWPRMYYNVAPADYGQQHILMTGQVQPQRPRMSSVHNSYRSPYTAQPEQMKNQASEGFVDTRGKSGISAPEKTHVVSSPTHPGMQAGESKEPTSPGGSSPLLVEPDHDLIFGLKKQVVQLLNVNRGKLMLSKVPAEYNKMFRQPLYLTEYNAQRLVHLIDNMKDTLVIKGDGTSKTLHLAKKKPVPVTNKSKPSSNGASAPQNNLDKMVTIERKYQSLSHISYIESIQNGSDSRANMVKDVAIIKEILDNRVKRFYLMAA